MDKKERVVRRSGGKLDLCLCPVCGAWHIKGKKKHEAEKFKKRKRG